MLNGKIWGKTEMLLANGVLEFHRIEAIAGGVCSKHAHEFKWNGFFVEKGKLLIRIWQKDYNLCDETILEEGDFTTVKPGLYHQFEALEDTVAFELYWAEFNHNDIVRETVGFDRKKKELEEFKKYESQPRKEGIILTEKEAELKYEQEVALNQ